MHTGEGARAAPGPAPGASLVERLPGRFVFVLGKGGVGKSTTAGGFALALADAGFRTHLVSVDPAHSLADLFGHPILAEPVPSLCSDRLVVEELDARTRGGEWLTRIAGGVGELVELGSYLDSSHVTRVLEPSLPGLDELVAAIRLTELERGECERVVVDTPPTGHALRILQCTGLLAGWVRALEAMAAKAAAVQEGLLRRRVRLEGEAVVDELRELTKRFERGVLPAADFLVVTGLDPLVRAETDRLVERLSGILPEARVVLHACRDGGAASPSRIPPSGCEGLREAWARGAPVEGGLPRTSVREGGGSTARHEGSERLLDRLGALDLLLFAGKGGVGKSTAAAACAVALAERRPVLLLSADPAGSLDDLFPSGGRLPPNLRRRQIEPGAELQAVRGRYRDEVRRLFERLGLERAASLDRRVVESLLELAPPAIDELFALGALVDEAGAGGGDATRLVVLDGAPTGHFLRLLDMPGSALAWTHSVMRVLVEQRVAAEVDDLTRRLLTFARRVRELAALLRDPVRTGVVVATLGEPMVLPETLRLVRALDERGVPIASILLNRHPSQARAVSRRVGAGLDAGPGIGPLRELLPDALFVAAPEVAEPPVGPDALADFLSRWQVLG